MDKHPNDDLDERGVSPRDKIKGDSLTLVSFRDKKKKRRISLAGYLSLVVGDKRERRMLGWVLPSLDGDPPHPAILASLLAQDARRKRKQAHDAREAEKRAQRSARRKLRKAAKV